MKILVFMWIPIGIGHKLKTEPFKQFWPAINRLIRQVDNQFGYFAGSSIDDIWRSTVGNPLVSGTLTFCTAFHKPVLQVVFTLACGRNKVGANRGQQFDIDIFVQARNTNTEVSISNNRSQFLNCFFIPIEKDDGNPV